MGVSAISSVSSCYSQNEKDLEAYYQALNADQLAVTRGITLNEDDHIRRYIIQQLACHFALNFTDVATKFGICFQDYFASELKQLNGYELDELITISDDKLLVSERGRFLVRVICMVFDANLKQTNTTQRFSKVI
jgi:oxygen-independent coproporphyrinogen-3 oxidase